MNDDIQLNVSTDIAHLLAHHTQLTPLVNGDVQLLINGCTAKNIESLAALLKQCGEVTPAKDFSAYFSAITGSTLYKPGNPRMAVMQVAKRYQLDMNELLAAFKEQTS